MTGKKKSLAVMFIILFTLFTLGCEFQSSDDRTDDNALKEGEETDIYFEDIVELMAMSREEVFEWWGANYTEIPSDGRKIEQYQEEKNHMKIIFTDVVGYDKIDSIEFEGSVDINGAKIGMTYDDIERAMPEGYWQKEVDVFEPEMLPVFQFGFDYEDFIVVFEMDSDDEAISRLRIARNIPFENIKLLLEMSKSQLWSRYGGVTRVGEFYELFDECWYNRLFGIAIKYREGWFDNVIYKTITPYNSYRGQVSGIRLGAKTSEILDSFGIPYYHGPAISKEHTYINGEILVYEADDGQLCFDIDQETGTCSGIYYMDWTEANFINPGAKYEEDIFNFSDCEIDGVRLGYTEEQVKRIKGASLTEGNYDGSSKDYRCGSVEYIFGKTDQGELILTHIYLPTVTIEGPRGTKIGDSYKDVISKFYSNYDAEDVTKDEFEYLYQNGYEVRGGVWFDEVNGVRGIEYLYMDPDNSATLTYRIENEIVTEIILYRPLPGMPLIP